MLVIAKKLVICSGKPEVLLGYPLHRKSSGFDTLIPSLSPTKGNWSGLAWVIVIIGIVFFFFHVHWFSILLNSSITLTGVDDLKR